MVYKLCRMPFHFCWWFFSCGEAFQLDVIPKGNQAWIYIGRIWYEDPIHWKRPWCWERWKAGGEGDDRGWDDWMASPTQWTLVWANSVGQWRTGKPGVLWFLGSQRVKHDSDWTATKIPCVYFSFCCLSCFWCCIQESLPKAFLPCFSSRAFTVLGI